MTALLLPALLACLQTDGSEMPVDVDGDGVTVDGGDCDDENANIFPGSPEHCDGLDNDCDGDIDESLLGVWYADADGDGYGDAALSEEECDLASGTVDNGEDCDDTDNTISPAADDICDGINNDCDDEVDEDPERIWYADSDGDGYGWAHEPTAACEQPSGTVDNDADCDDTSAEALPGGAEVCDGLDNDCDGARDEDDAADAAYWYLDADGDGHGVADIPVQACDAPKGYASSYADCDDTDSAIHPDADEVCDGGIDNDCSSLTEEDDSASATTWHPDVDGDGYGDIDRSRSACEQPSGAVADGTDCDDEDAAAFPGNAEVCDGIDNDCDGSVDDSVAASLLNTWYVDSDGDGFGGIGSMLSCDAPTGYAAVDGDCDDSDDLIRPDADEECDDVDNNCDGQNNESGAAGELEWHDDSDGDGFGDPDSSTAACDAPSGTVADTSDCDDTDSAIHPDADEVCGDDVDDDCDGELENDCPETHCGSITADETWSADTPHEVTCDVSVDDSSDPTLTIEDGAVVTFADEVGLYIGERFGGSLVVEGTADGVVLTSAQDSPAARDWSGLFIGEDAFDIELQGLTVEYAGAEDGSCVNITDATVSLLSATIQHCGNNGIHADSSSTLELSSSTVSDAEVVGVYVAGELETTLGPTFIDNTLTDNGTYPLSIPFQSVDQLDDSSTFTGNGSDLIKLTEEDVTEVIDVKLMDADYFVAESLRIGDGSGEVTVEPGVTFYNDTDVMWTIGWSGDGILYAEGTESAPITWTSAQSSPAAGDWKGLYLYYTWSSDADLSNVVIEYGGDALGANLVCWHSAFSITDSIIRSSSGYGIKTTGCSSATISGITYEDNADSDTN